MKVLFVVNNDYTAMNGVAVVSRYLAEGIASNGNDVYVITSSHNSGKTNKCIINGVKIFRFDVRYDRLKNPVGEIENYCKFLLSSQYDVMIFECLQTPMTDLAMPLLKDICADIYLHSHDFSGLYLVPFKFSGDIMHSLGNTLNYFVWRRYYSNFVPKYINGFTGILSLSKCNKDYEYLNRKYTGRHYVLGNAADDMFFSEEQGENVDVLRGKEKKYFINIANYSNIKNQIGILKEYYKSDASKRFAMVFCGSCENKYYERLVYENNKLQKKYGIREVQILHSVERNKIPGIISNAMIYICGSEWEAYSISLIEAMAVGIPFVSTNVGNAKELPGGYTVEKIKDLSKAIDYLMMDDQLRMKYQKEGKEFALCNCRKDVAVSKLQSIIGCL